MNIELKPIAESKIRQLVGDVCGVLVRTEDGVMAVSEHGRCTRLDAGVMGPVAPDGMSERELFEQRFSVPAGIYWNEISEQYDALPGAAGFDEVEIYHGQWMAWQAARAQSGQGAEPVAWASPLPDGTEQVTKELPERIYGVVPKDYQWYVRPLVYADIYWNEISEQYDALPGAAGFDDVEIYHGKWQAWQAARARSGQGVEPAAWATKQANGRLITASTDRNAELEWSENYVGATVVPLYEKPQPAQQGSVPHWKELEALADEYVEGYEFRGDEGDYQPTEQERFLIQDCVAGLMDEVHQMLKRATPQPAVPEGWKLVPVEPTNEMRRKAGLHRGADYYTILQVWNAMLSVAPQPPKEGEGNE